MIQGEVGGSSERGYRRIKTQYIGQKTKKYGPVGEFRPYRICHVNPGGMDPS